MFISPESPNNIKDKPVLSGGLNVDKDQLIARKMQMVGNNDSILSGNSQGDQI